ncbi:MAG: hypothetical protein N2559_13250 [Anaerolineae bacterium]|nr:hypothetical protein [Anaerolineae bacterium]
MNGSKFTRFWISVAWLFAVMLFGGVVTLADTCPTCEVSKTSQVYASAPQSTPTYTLYLPMIARNACAPIAGETYGTVTVLSAPTNPPAAVHPDLNLGLRGYALTSGTLGLVNYDGHADPSAPQLYTLFGDNRVPSFSAVYRVYEWDWVNNRRGAWIDDPPVTLAGMVVVPNEIIRVPSSGHDIGLMTSGYEVMVLYATPNRITLKYTREDNVVNGYTIHIENICVEPNLLALYDAMNAAGRARLPALYAGQGIGRAIGTEIGVAIRDTGTFMDPRSRKDWWQGK